jgi:hypothetical protein
LSGELPHEFDTAGHPLKEGDERKQSGKEVKVEARVYEEMWVEITA